MSDNAAASALTFPSNKAKGKGKNKSKTPSKSTRERALSAKLAVCWAHRYTATAVVLSSGLNAFAAVHETASQSLPGQIGAGGIGASIPLLVWMLGTVVAHTYKAGWTRLALVGAGIATCMLGLSVWHVAAALSLLTGSNLLMSGLLAIGIDCGLVASEATAILVNSTE